MSYPVAIGHPQQVISDKFYFFAFYCHVAMSRLETQNQVTTTAGISFVTNFPPTGGTCEVSVTGTPLVRVCGVVRLASDWEFNVKEVYMNTCEASHTV